MESALRGECAPNVRLTSIRTDKFKTAALSINLLLPLREETASINALLPYVLRRGTARHPDMESLAAALDELYGAVIEPVVRKVGEVQCIGFYADFIDGKFLPDGGDMLSRVCAMLGELLLTPATRGGLLRAEYVKGERDNLCDRIRSTINDKRSWSLLRLKELMCPGESYGVGVYGTVEAAEKITQTALTRRYREILDAARIEVFYCGSAERADVEDAVRDALFTLPSAKALAPVDTEVITDCGDVRYFTDHLDVTQGKLALGFRLGSVMLAPDWPAIMVFNAVYGGSVTSKLFMNVREKLSLCYFASSSIDKQKGCMFVSSGIEFSKYQEALDEILLQLKACAEGEFSSEELDGAKSYLSSSLRAYEDSSLGLESFYLLRAVDSLSWSPDELASLVELVKKDSVVNVAQSVRLDAVYFLAGQADGKEEE